MSGIRWTTGIGIAVGGASGAILALLGIGHPQSAAPEPKTAASAVASASAEPAPAAPSTAAAPPAPSEPSAAPPEEPVLVASAASAVVEASSAATASSKAPEGAPRRAPALELPTTRDALLKAELYCDKRQDFDECERAAAALEAGSAGPADPAQAKRFRRIALTHLVAQCEAGSAHACFVMATKYRAGTELAASTARAEALEKRGLELCRLGRSAPECPTPP